jgi:hypothetical protein
MQQQTHISILLQLLSTSAFLSASLWLFLVLSQRIGRRFSGSSISFSDSMHACCNK